MDDLQRDGALEALVQRAVNGRHPTAGDARAHAVTPIDERTEERIGDGGVHWLRVYG
jgi:hypothetical protein